MPRHWRPEVAAPAPQLALAPQACPWAPQGTQVPQVRAEMDMVEVMLQEAEKLSRMAHRGFLGPGCGAERRPGGCSSNANRCERRWSSRSSPASKPSRPWPGWHACTYNTLMLLMLLYTTYTMLY